jgi:hypothetical protein
MEPRRPAPDVARQSIIDALLRHATGLAIGRLNDATSGKIRSLETRKTRRRASTLAIIEGHNPTIEESTSFWRPSLEARGQGGRCDTSITEPTKINKLGYAESTIGKFKSTTHNIAKTVGMRVQIGRGIYAFPNDPVVIGAVA